MYQDASFARLQEFLADLTDQFDNPLSQ